MSRFYNVLFLSAANAARSIMAEAILARMAPDRFRVFSAGIMPEATLHPAARLQLEQLDYDTRQLVPKSFNTFLAQSAPQLDFVISLSPASDPIIKWPGEPITAPWPIKDPGRVGGDVQKLAFWQAHGALQRRIEHFISLPFEQVSRPALRMLIRSIGDAPAGAALDS